MVKAAAVYSATGTRALSPLLSQGLEDALGRRCDFNLGDDDVLIGSDGSCRHKFSELWLCRSFQFCFARSLRFPCVLGFNEGFQVGQAARPEAAVVLDPGVDSAKWFGVKLVNAVSAFAVLANEVGGAQRAQVFGDGGARKGECLGDLAGGLAAAPQ